MVLKSFLFIGFSYKALKATATITAQLRPSKDPPSPDKEMRARMEARPALHAKYGFTGFRPSLRIQLGTQGSWLPWVPLKETLGYQKGYL